jgi:hypothetical protein
MNNNIITQNGKLESAGEVLRFIYAGTDYVILDATQRCLIIWVRPKVYHSQASSYSLKHEVIISAVLRLCLVWIGIMFMNQFIQAIHWSVEYTRKATSIWQSSTVGNYKVV